MGSSIYIVKPENCYIVTTLIYNELSKIFCYKCYNAINQ